MTEKTTIPTRDAPAPFHNAAPDRWANRDRAIRRFVGTLERLVPKHGEVNRAALAALRTGLGRRSGTAIAMYQVIGQHIRGGDKSDRDLSFEQVDWNDAVCVVAALYGLHPVPLRRGGPESGNSNDDEDQAAALSWRTQSFPSFLPRTGDTDRDRALNRRVVSLIDADRDALPVMLRHAIGLLDDSTAIDWFQLTRDVLDWERDDRDVQKRWARAWWTSPSRDEIAKATEDASDTATAPGTL